MLGWHISVFRIEDGERADRIAVWQAGLSGLDWITDLVEAGQATGGGNGYPMRYRVRAHDARAALKDPPHARDPWARDAGDTVTERWLGRTTIDHDAVDGLADDGWLEVEAWDES
jgi:hypothetical protein